MIETFLLYGLGLVAAGAEWWRDGFSYLACLLAGAMIADLEHWWFKRRS